VAAALLHEQGHEVIGIHMKLHGQSATGPNSEKRCCGLTDAFDARAVAERLKIPFYIMDLQEEFRSAVMDYFAAEYLAGRTPNPCIQCNGVLKFDLLLKRTAALGASHLATGHYARVEDGGLAVARDPDKDQTYFLFPVRSEALPRVLFPLGNLTKAEVREEARRLGLATAEKPESQEICFVPRDDHASFIRRFRPDAQGAGPIVHMDGRELGSHDGYWRFTVGQRRGLGIALGEPVYVISVNASTHTVVVGPNEALQHHELWATGMNWFRNPVDCDNLCARIRHRGALIPCDLEIQEGGALVRFRGPARAAAPGQAVVLYDGERVVGGGWIQEVRS